MSKNNLQKRGAFVSRIGFIFAAAGSAIGLGNIWRFPYIAGENGGAAFILIYLVCIALIGLPVMLAAFSIGRNTKKSAITAYKKLSPDKPWFIGGVSGVVAAIFTMSFYSIVAGWTFSYIFKSIFANLTVMSPDQLGNLFVSHISGVWSPIFWHLAVIVISCLILFGGVKEGIEKWSKILMPALFILLVVLVARGLTLEGSWEGIKFLLYPDFTKITVETIVMAFGQAFFSLSLGMGTMITYASYVSKSENLPKTALMVTAMDTGIALLAGFAIFPAVFALGFEPTGGSSLVFSVLPAVFGQMPLGSFFSTLFFLLLGIAALTSAISIMEVIIAYFVDEHHWGRKKSVILTGIALFLAGLPSALSMNVLKDYTWFGKTFFDLMDYMASNILLPFGGLVIALFVGYQWGVDKSIDELSNGGTVKSSLFKTYGFIIKYVAPALILLVFLNAIGILNMLWK
ncbi:MAG: sodium-dependent transporter [Firmicutes bacterium]|nr:sodium-dependent transporter [Bacillota bacterium]